MATREMQSYLPEMQHVPNYLNQHFRNRNYLLIFPNQTRESEYKKQTRAIGNMDDFMEIGNIVSRIFK
ncbi:hypothetical protein SDC9_154567 [bioreactor metagenome]|uniref:Uncharacterized protein n=2 Tax=root TaxID=1 RepID=A0A645EZ40_9ZZZZ